MEGSGQKSPHILAIPYPLMGHMTPIVQLCKILIVQAGCGVTIACSDKMVAGLRRLLQPEKLQLYGSSSSSISVLIIGDGLPEDDNPADWDVLREQLHAFHEVLPRSFAKHIHRFRSDVVTMVLSDLYLSWTQDVAHQLGIPRVALWISPAAEFQVYFHAEELVKAGKLPFKAPLGREKEIDNMIVGTLGRPPTFHHTNGTMEGEESITIYGLPPMARKDFPTFLQIEDASDEFFFTFIEHVKTSLKASMLLFNTFEALEGPLLDVLRSQGIPAHTIGPLFMLEDAVMKDHVQQIEQEYPECLKWLDGKEPNSVIYVAFGTLIVLPMAQVKELAQGLLNSGQGFIWVYPKPKGDVEGRDEFLKSFKEQVHGKGLVLEWAPQKHILGHPSTGAFLSHCGWNSTLEAISCGVPMVCLAINL